MIKMSPKYGINPTKRICFWCGEFTGELIFRGHIEDPDIEGSDIEAADCTVCNYELCRYCKSMFRQGVGIIEVVPADKWKDYELSKYDPNRPELINGLIPTGRFYVFKEDVFPNAKAGFVGFLSPEEFDSITINEDN